MRRLRLTKGDVGIQELVYTVLLGLVIIGGAIFLWNSGIVGKSKTLPGYNDSQVLHEDPAFLRYDLLAGTVEFSNSGTEWSSVDDGTRTGDLLFSSGTLGADFARQYFGSAQRTHNYTPLSKTSGFMFYPNEPTRVKPYLADYFESVSSQDPVGGAASVLGHFYFYDPTAREGFADEQRYERFRAFIVGFDNRVWLENFKGEYELVTPERLADNGISLMQTSDYKQLVSDAVAWRDSILVGGAQPLPIVLRHTNLATKHEDTRTYPLERIDHYLVVRLRDLSQEGSA